MLIDNKSDTLSVSSRWKQPDPLRDRDVEETYEINCEVTVANLLRTVISLLCDTYNRPMRQGRQPLMRRFIRARMADSSLNPPSVMQQIPLSDVF